MVGAVMGEIKGAEAEGRHCAVGNNKRDTGGLRRSESAKRTVCGVHKACGLHERRDVHSADRERTGNGQARPSALSARS